MRIGTDVAARGVVPFKFTGDLNRVVIQLSDSPLSPETEEQICRAKAALSVSE